MLMKKMPKNRINNEFVVLLSEEYGVRDWFWFPKMVPGELEEWWKNLESVVPYCVTPEPLPGDVIQAVDNLSDIHCQLEKSGTHYSAHIHCDDDSFLMKPNGEKIFHKAHKEYATLLMKEISKSRIDNEFVVLLSEEYGYRDWLWFPKMTPGELEEWWENLESVFPYFMTPEPLPGDVIEANDNLGNIYYELSGAGTHYSAHIHCDDDSFLMRPNGEKIFHKPYHSYRDDD
ncbi:hypothetical protein QUF72_03605 [Desulfobacterales bacterium HSG2]|nr:hypothetical protein [Desulfobacterales bacterium HSG2]